MTASLPQPAAGLLAQSAERFGLSDGAHASLASLAAFVAASEHAPTTVTDPTAIVQDHVADSLVALELSEVAEARLIVDVGSGAGFPGLVLAAALPAAAVTLLDGNGRKVEFANAAIAAAGLRNARAVHARAEEYPELAAADLVTARAVAPLTVLVEYAAPLLRLGGHLLAWRGAREAQAEAEAEVAADRLGLQAERVVPVSPYPAARNRNLHLFSKVSRTPPGFPRRPGVARKRPLGVRAVAGSRTASGSPGAPRA